MQKSLSLFKRSFTVVSVMVVTFIAPVSAGVSYADETCQAPSTSTPGVHQPVGSDSGTYTYQCDGQYAGNYTNAYYEYSPTTGITTPLYSPNYQYDCTTQQWTMAYYNYSATQSNYYPTRIKTAAPAGETTNCPVIAPTNGATGTGTTGSGTGTNGISNTGNGSNNGTSSNTGINIGTTNNNTLSLNNGLTAIAGTGNATVSGNTIGGSAASGSAQNIANIANLLQTSSNAFGPGTATFTANINGDVTGDFMFDPSAIMNTGTNSSNNTTNNAKLTVNQANNTDASINNNINVGSTSGDATVTGNTKAGDATSGDATTVVNLMNLINSTVAAGQSFVGTININGNLNGDILLPQNMLDQVLAASGANSKNSVGNNLDLNAGITNNTTEGITNNVTTSAASGNADVSGNTEAGTATSGNANNNVTLLNLTGSQVVGADDLLVFVNVLGHWVGMIMNAPAGSTAASLGGGITSTGANSTNTAANNTSVNATGTNNTHLGINNTVNASANSGDASVTDNTIGGNAKSGNAKTAVNILNIGNSTINLSNWFGVLFINVFGNWTGSFGVNTAAGNTQATASGSSAAVAAAAQAATAQFATFVNHSAPSASGTATTTNNQNVSGSATDIASQVLGSTKQAAKTVPTPDTETHASYLLPVIGVSIATIMLVGERVVTMRKSRSLK